MMVVAVRKKPVKPPHLALKMLYLTLLDIESVIEVLGVLQCLSRRVQSMDHIIYSWAVLWLRVASASVVPSIRSFHLRAALSIADALELNYQEVQFNDELPNVLVLPIKLIHSLWDFAYLLDISGIRACRIDFSESEKWTYESFATNILKLQGDHSFPWILVLA